MLTHAIAYQASGSDDLGQALIVQRQFFNFTIVLKAVEQKAQPPEQGPGGRGSVRAARSKKLNHRNGAGGAFPSQTSVPPN